MPNDTVIYYMRYIYSILCKHNENTARQHSCYRRLFTIRLTINSSYLSLTWEPGFTWCGSLCLRNIFTTLNVLREDGFNYSDHFADKDHFSLYMYLLHNGFAQIKTTGQHKPKHLQNVNKENDAKLNQ